MGNLAKPNIGLLSAQPRWAARFLGTRLSLCLEQGRLEATSAQKPQMCFESKAPDLVIPSANPTSLACSGMKSTVGRSGPTCPALPLSSLLPTTALAREAGSYLFHQTLPPQPGQEAKQPGQQAEEVSSPLKSAKYSSQCAKNNKK